MIIKRSIAATKNLLSSIKKLLSSKEAKCEIPDYLLREFAKCLLPDIVAFCESEEGKRKYEEWKRKREQSNKLLTEKTE